ncbi:MAG: response regulator [Pseudolabrys sp.]|jgi:CheY-like chemotaxis protein
MNASHKVLVVDDDPAVRKSIDRVLTSKGYAVITAENGEEALRKLNEEKYDLVYTDIRMPGISGLEVAEQVKARKPWTPVVIITGYGTDAAEARAKAAGVSSFVHKPLSPAMIEDSARDALAGPKAQVLALPTAAEAPKVEPAARGSALLNVVLFFAAPFIGLAYIVAFPFVGIGIMAVLATRAAAKNNTLRTIGVTLKHIAMVFAAPVLGLAYILLFPFIGLASLLWLAGRAFAARKN